MIDVSMTTNEKDIPIEYGMYNFGAVRDHALSSVKYILADITDIKQRYISLGFHLWEFKENECYKDFGFDSFKEFCKVNLPIDTSVCSRCIQIWYRFAMEQNGVRKMFLDDKYREYDYAQLQEMVNMDSTEIALVNPQMSSREMRQLKKKVLVPPEALKWFIEYHQNDDMSLSKRELYDEMDKEGKRYSHCSNYPNNFDMKPGKASICGSKYYKFNQLIDAYENEFGALPSSSDAAPHLKGICVSDLCDKKGKALSDCIKSAEPIKRNLTIHIFDEKGKCIQIFENYDVLLNGDTTLVVRFSKTESEVNE